MPHFGHFPGALLWPPSQFIGHAYVVLWPVLVLVSLLLPSVPGRETSSEGC